MLIKEKKENPDKARHWINLKLTFIYILLILLFISLLLLM